MDLDDTLQMQRPTGIDEKLRTLKLELDATYELLEKQLEAKTPKQRQRVERHLERWTG